MRYTYKAYGLILDCDSELSFFTHVPESDIQADVTLTLNDSPIGLPSADRWARRYPAQHCESHGIEVWGCENWLRIEYPITQECTLKFYLSRDGKQLIADKPASMLFSDLQAFVLGSTFGCLLRLHKKVCLHASVLSYDGRAFALIGHKGAGKSTTSAALLNAGAKLISDDIAVLDFESERIIVESGYPAIRLLPNSLKHYTKQLSQFRTVLSFSDKRYVPVPSPMLNWQFSSERLPLKAIYILNSRDISLDSCKINTLSNAESLMAITPHSYTAYMLDDLQRKAEFKSLAEIARRISIKNISCKDNLDALPNIASDIIRDLEQAHH